MQIYITRSKQGIESDLEGPAKISRGPKKSCEGPSEFYSSTFFNFYFNPCTEGRRKYYCRRRNEARALRSDVVYLFVCLFVCSSVASVAWRQPFKGVKNVLPSEISGCGEGLFVASIDVLLTL